MITLATALALALGASDTNGPPPIRVAPGMQQTIEQPGLSRVAIPDPSVADVKVIEGRQVLIMGKKKGRTSLTMWANGKMINRMIVVDDNKSSEIAREVREVIGANLRVETFNDRTVIMGTLDSLQDLQRLNQLVGDDANVKLLVDLNPALLPVIAREITDALHKHGLPYASANAVGTRIVLEGSVADQDEYKKAQLIADSYFSLVR